MEVSTECLYQCLWLLSLQSVTYPAYLFSPDLVSRSFHDIQIQHLCGSWIPHHKTRCTPLYAHQSQKTNTTMPKGKLKAALATHTVNAQRYAAAKKKEAHKHDKEASVKASMSGARKAAKRRARAEGRAGTREEGKDGKGGKGGKEEEGDDVVEGAGGLDGAVRSGNGVEDVVVGAGSSKGSTPTSTSTPTPTPTTASTSTGIRPTIPFLPSDTILLLGEANFSFALSLITHHRHPGYQLLATSYDSQEVCFHKYPDAETNVQRLREAGAGVEFGVDGGRLEGCKRVGKGRWSRVIMNFPHTGMLSAMLSGGKGLRRENRRGRGRGRLWLCGLCALLVQI